MQWAEPTQALPEGGSDVLTPEQVQSWKEQGFALVHGVWPTEVIDATVAALDEIFDKSPPAGATDFGSGGKLEFPTESPAVNAITLHPRLLRAMEQLLGTADMRLTQSDVWPKWGREGAPKGPRDNLEQRVHVDYPNHTLTHPSDWSTPDVVELILYYDDVDYSGGPTALVAREGADDAAYAWPLTRTPGVGELPWINDKDSAEEYLSEHAPEVADFRKQLYAREKYARYRRGTVLLYRHDTWHRGTRVTPGRLRRVQNMTFRRADADWIPSWNNGWARAMYRASMVMEKLVAEASVEQRNVLGFPRPGHRFWTPATLLAVAARYGPLGMDMQPYEDGIAAANAAAAAAEETAAATAAAAAAAATEGLAAENKRLRLQLAAALEAAASGFIGGCASSGNRSDVSGVAGSGGSGGSGAAVTGAGGCKEEVLQGAAMVSAAG